MEADQRTVAIPIDAPIWSRFFVVAPLVIVGSREPDGGHDLAPKHMAMPLGWQNFYCFACSPRHATQRNIERTGQYTISFPRPGQIIQTSMAAGPREPDNSKPTLAALETFAAQTVDGVLVHGCSVWLECELERIIGDFGEHSLIIGRVTAASADERALRLSDGDDADMIYDSPLLAYLSPGRFASVSESFTFPYPADFKP
jgi:flavin reductase (DIM6/NTAB) family NADH-FMN oxidoreductase RutF